MLVLTLLSLVLFCFSPQTFSHAKPSTVDVCSVWTEDWRNSIQVKDLIYSAVKPTGGASAGKYSKIRAKNWYDCVKQCCQFERCNVAYWISSTCLHIECISDELCEPTTGDNSDIDDLTLFLKVRSIQNTAAAIDYEDPGRDECNNTKPCAINERCEEVAINAQIKRHVCLCNRENNFRRINGVCRQYISRTKPCAIYEKDRDSVDEITTEDTSRGLCRRNEECLPPNDRAKHGYCQCKLGFTRASESSKCLVDGQYNVTGASTGSPTKSTRVSSLSDIEVQAGEDQTLVLPTSQVDFYGHVFQKSNRSEMDLAALKRQNLNLVWSLKSSNNGAQVDILKQGDVAAYVMVKGLREGVYEFELQLNNDQGTTLASDTVKVEVVAAKTTTATPPLALKIISPLNVRLPQRVVKLQTRIEPSNRRVTYLWTYMKDGPVTPILENADSSDLLVSNLRPGNYSFRLRALDSLGNEQVKTVQLAVTGEPIEARVATRREIVFWPSNDVILDGSTSITEGQTNVHWSLLSTDNRQKSSDIEILSPRALKTRVSNLRIGQYRFQLTLTTDDRQYTSDAEVVVIVYAQNGQPPAIRLSLETKNVNVLNNLIVLNASGSTADYGIAKWQWTKSPSSPAMGHFLNNSQTQPIAYITHLIEGQYVFHLQLSDDRQQMSEANITVNVKGVPDAENVVEVLLQSKPYLHQQTLDNLLSQMRVFLLDVLPDIHIVMVGMIKEHVLLIRGEDRKTDAIISPKLIADHLRAKIKPLRSASNTDIVSINTYLCLSNCSNHGKCSHETKHCVCDRYYMENWFKSFVRQEPNCDFLIHYFALITIVGLIATIIVCWLCLCCCYRSRRRRSLLERRRRIRYQLLHENDDDDSPDSPYNMKEQSKSKSRSPKKNKGKGSNVVLSESDYDVSDENGEQTLYDKPLLTAKVQVKSSANSKSRGLKVPVQDNNGSPMVRNTDQSPATTDNSLA